MNYYYGQQYLNTSILSHLCHKWLMTGTQCLYIDRI